MTRSTASGLLLLLLAACTDSSAPPPMVSDAASRAPDGAPTVTPQNSNTTQGLIAVSPVNDRVVWASGRGGTFVVTTDGGNTWRAGAVPGAEALQFRDVEGISAREAYLLSIGTGTDSRIYHTRDGGRSWTLQFTNQDPNGFYDCFAFFNSDRALVMGDAVGTRWPILRTNNGRNWTDIGDRVVPALPGEAGFASSGTCIATAGGNRAWFVAGGVAPFARIFATTDGGNHWGASETPLRGSPSAGIFSVAFRDRQHGIIAGGDLDPTAPAFDTNASSDDGGATWTLGARAPIGTVFGVAYVQAGRGVVATGPGGTAWSADEGASWTQIDGLTGFWGVAFASPRAGWVVGVNGTITKLSFATRHGGHGEDGD
jgi:photosystem II stability/assembly factor-like uncharacterized protein